MSTNPPEETRAGAARRCLLIHDLVVPCSIGVHEHERHANATGADQRPRTGGGGRTAD